MAEGPMDRRSLRLAGRLPGRLKSVYDVGLIFFAINQVLILAPLCGSMVSSRLQESHRSTNGR